jgi:hypothetical protein
MPLKCAKNILRYQVENMIFRIAPVDKQLN